MLAELSWASRCVGAHPSGALRQVSLAVRRALAKVDEACPIVVALSGGADSLALAVATIDVATRTGRRVLTATVDHGLRPESGEEARHVAALARDLGAQAHIFPVTLTGALGPEGAARAARRKALVELARAENAPIFLGHTMNDQAETVLLRLARGSGVGSLRAMSPDITDEDGVRWMRPLLDIPRHATRQACRQAGLTWVEDPTNSPHGPLRAQDGSPLRRSALRAQALPVLAQALGVDPIAALARSAQLAARDDDALETWARAQWENAHIDVPIPACPIPEAKGAGRGQCPGEHDPQSAATRSGLDALALADLPRAVRTRILRRFALGEGARAGDLKCEHIEELDSLITHWHGQGSISLPGVKIRRIRDLHSRPVLVAESSH